MFALCRRWLERQTRPPDVWVVSTDTGEVVPDLPSNAIFVQVGPVADGFGHLPGDATTRDKTKIERRRRAGWALHEALGAVPDDCMAIPFEDDDWYGASHIERLAAGIESGARLCCGDTLVRYHLPTMRWFECSQDAVVEGACAIAPAALAEFRSSFGRDGRPTGGLVQYRGWTTLGMKGVGHGIAGREGATGKHSPSHALGAKYRSDTSYRWLIEKIGAEDAAAYISLLRSHGTP